MKIRWIPISEAPPILPNNTVSDIVDVKLKDDSVCEGFLKKSKFGTFWLIKDILEENIFQKKYVSNQEQNGSQKKKLENSIRNIRK